MHQFVAAAATYLQNASQTTLPTHQNFEASIGALRKPEDPHRDQSGGEYWLLNLITSVVVDQEEIAIMEEFYTAISGDPELASVRGAVGFFLASRRADAAGRARVQGDGRRSFASADRYLADPAVRGFIAHIYETQDAVQSHEADARFIASGSTSYIIHYSGAANFVLKLIKPYYFSNTPVQKQTVGFEDNVRQATTETQVLPKVFASGPLYIMMEFIPGDSLAELRLSGELYRLSPSERLDILYGIIDGLEHLSTPHLDLSPSNVMLQRISSGTSESKRFHVRLIDLGYNYLLRDDIFGSAYQADIVRYSAPELRQSLRQASVKSDLFSLGMILGDLLAPEPVYRDLSVQLDFGWREYPQLTAVMEDLIAENPAERAPWADQLDLKAVYAQLRRILKEERRIYALQQKQLEPSTAFGGLVGPAVGLVRNLASIPSLWKLQSNRDISTRKATYLFSWSTLINAYLLVCLAVCGYVFLAKTIDVSAFAPDAFSGEALEKSWETFKAFLQALGSDPVRQSAVAGQSIALVVVLVVGQYYNRIFSTFTTRTSNVASAPMAEITMRATPFIIGALCVSTTVLFPAWWYVTSFIGPLVTAANNWAVLRFCREVEVVYRAKITDTFLSSTDLSRFIEDFQRWPQAMALAGLMIFSVGCVIRFGFVGQEAIWGIVIAYLCYAGLFQDASTNRANLIRSGLNRFEKAGERLVKRGQIAPMR